MDKMKVKLRITESGLVYCNIYNDGYFLCKGWEYQDSRCDECPLKRIKEHLRG